MTWKNIYKKNICSQEDMVCLSCTGTGERVCLSAEGFGNRQCFLESIADKVGLPKTHMYIIYAIYVSSFKISLIWC